MARTLSEIIDALGVTAIQREMGLQWPSTVHQWKVRKNIPSGHLNGFIAASIALGKPTTSEELIAAMAGHKPRATVQKRKRGRAA